MSISFSMSKRAGATKCLFTVQDLKYLYDVVLDMGWRVYVFDMEKFYWKVKGGN